MSDTRAITNRDIARAKAIADGWEAVEMESRNWWICAPDGTICLAGMGDEANCWAWIDDHLDAPYLEDANAALSLVTSFFVLETGRADGDKTVWRARFGLNDDYFVKADTPAEAIAKAFMAYRAGGG